VNRRFEALPAAQRDEFQRRVIDRKRPPGLSQAIRKAEGKTSRRSANHRHRKASELALDVLVAEVPELVLGIADLTRPTTPGPRA